MGYLIDTDILIYSIKGNSIVQSHFRSAANMPKSISVITYGELLFGAKKSEKSQKNVAVVYRIRELFPVIGIGNSIIEVFSDLKAGSRKKGDVIDDMDLLIASTAMSLNLTLVTNNEKHFNRIKGLEIVNWSKP